MILWPDVKNAFNTLSEITDEEITTEDLLEIIFLSSVSENRQSSVTM